MRIGILGDPEDLQSATVAKALSSLGATPVWVSPDALEREEPFSMKDGRAEYRAESLEDVRAYYVRHTPSTMAPAMERDDALVLFEDWFTHYMHRRERATFVMAWLLRLQHEGVRLVNGPHAASVFQFKPFQLDVLRRLGARVPRTLISNDPTAVRAFLAAQKDVIYKPVMGGAVTRRLDGDALERLDDIKKSPVIFQERIEGDDLRVMLIGDEIVSSVAIRTPTQHLDFRDDPVYSGGEAQYEEVTLPTEVAALCRHAARACGLTFAGIDIKRTRDEWVFLELNSSPIYLDVELKLGHPISAALARCLVEGAKG